jgi:hypothetical protein
MQYSAVEAMVFHFVLLASAAAIAGVAFVLIRRCDRRESARRELRERIDALMSRCLVQSEVGQYRQAVMTLDELLKLDPSNGQAQALRSNFIRSLLDQNGGPREIPKDPAQCTALEFAKAGPIIY